MPTDPVFGLAKVEAGLLGTRFAGTVRHFDLVGSTNQLALEAAMAGERTGVWVADEQTAGRGRGNHTWHSAPGYGLYLSALVTPDIPVQEARWLPMRAGLAVQAAVAEVTDLQLDLRWPNDLLLGDRKCGGILVESGSNPAATQTKEPSAAFLRFAVIGIGLNVGHRSFPSELAALATSLFLETDRLYAREFLLSAILRHLDREISQASSLKRERVQAEDVAYRFTAGSTWVRGKRVRVGADPDGMGGYTGLTRGLDSNGFLRVQDDEGQIQTVISGNVRAARE